MKGDLVYIPIGSHENHGPHLPPETDYLIAFKIINGLNTQIKGILDFGIDIGYSPEHLGFASTKSLKKEEFISAIQEKITYYKDVKNKILINTHGGNSKILKEIKESDTSKFMLFDIFKIIKNDLLDLRTSDIGGICHAGEYETSLMLFLLPERVKLNQISLENVKYVPELDPCYEGERLKEWKSMDFNSCGILGDPFKATKEKGEKWFTLIINKITRELRDKIIM